MDMLITVGLLAIGVTVGVTAYGAVSENSRRVKLISDVRNLNSAVCVYIANGGDKSELKDEASVLRKLKQTRIHETRQLSTFAGSGQLIDSRINCVPQSSELARDKCVKAYWCPKALAFKITSDSRPGIHKFFMCDKAGEKDYGVDESQRDTAFTYAERSKWIWDYDERPAEKRKGVSAVPLYNRANTSIPVPETIASTVGTVTSVSGFSSRSDSYSRSGGSSGGSSGGFALNAGSGTASTSGGVAINVLSDNVSSEEGELAVGVANLEIRLDNVPGVAVLGNVASRVATVGADTLDTVSSEVVPVAKRLESSTVLAERLAISEGGTRANLGKGESSVSEGIALNGGSGDSKATNALTGNIGGGEASSTGGGAINLGSGTARSGGD